MTEKPRRPTTRTKQRQEEKSTNKMVEISKINYKEEI